MNRMQLALDRAATELSLRVEIGRVVTLSDGRELVSEALFPDLGNISGTLVFCSGHAVDARTRHDLARQNYSVSIFSEPLPSEVFDIRSYAEMFEDWGWGGSESNKPTWMA